MTKYHKWCRDDLLEELQKMDNKLRCVNRRFRKLRAAVSKLDFSYGKAQMDFIQYELEKAMK